MQIIELCREDDKKANTLVNIAINEGRKVFNFRRHYVVLLAENNYWHSPDAVFRSMPDGLYVFRGERVYLVQ